MFLNFDIIFIPFNLLQNEMEAQVSTVIHDGTKHFENEKLINIADDIKLNFKTNYDIVDNQIAKSDELNITNLSEIDNPQDAQGKNQAPNVDQGKCEGEISSNCTDVGLSKEKSDNENEESKTKQIEEDEKVRIMSFVFMYIIKYNTVNHH